MTDHRPPSQVTQEKEWMKPQPSHQLALGHIEVKISAQDWERLTDAELTPLCDAFDEFMAEAIFEVRKKMRKVLQDAGVQQFTIREP